MAQKALSELMKKTAFRIQATGGFLRLQPSPKALPPTDVHTTSVVLSFLVLATLVAAVKLLLLK